MVFTFFSFLNILFFKFNQEGEKAKMKKNTKIMLAVIPAILAPIIFYSYHSGFIAKIQGYSQDISFDNSKPGLWQIKMEVVSETDKEINGISSKEVCIDQKTIDLSVTKPLKEKLSLNNMDCKIDTKRLSKNYGEFSLSCEGKNPSNGHNVKAKINGNILSKEEYNEVNFFYDINNDVDKPSSFTRKASAKRIGDCPKAN